MWCWYPLGVVRILTTSASMFVLPHLSIFTSSSAVLANIRWSIINEQEVGVKLDEKGRVAVNPHTFRTSVPNIYAIGKYTPPLSHIKLMGLTMICLSSCLFFNRRLHCRADVGSQGRRRWHRVRRKPRSLESHRASHRSMHRPRRLSHRPVRCIHAPWGIYIPIIDCYANGPAIDVWMN